MTPEEMAELYVNEMGEYLGSYGWSEKTEAYKKDAIYCMGILKSEMEKRKAGQLQAALSEIKEMESKPKISKEWVEQQLEKGDDADAFFVGCTDSTPAKITKTFDSIRDLVLKKNADYGDSAFDKPLLCPEMDAATAIRVRMSDKIRRVIQLEGNPAQVNGESLADAYRDIVGYCVLRLVEMGG